MPKIALNRALPLAITASTERTGTDKATAISSDLRDFR